MARNIRTLIQIEKLKSLILWYLNMFTNKMIFRLDDKHDLPLSFEHKYGLLMTNWRGQRCKFVKIHKLKPLFIMSKSKVKSG